MSDLISRQEAIETAKDWYDGLICGSFKGLEKRLEALPPAQPKQRWIPCSEQLPSYGEDVLISIGEYCNVGHVVPVNEEEQYNWYFSGWYHSQNDVEAWMPLPDPYKEGGEQE